MIEKLIHYSAGAALFLVLMTLAGPAAALEGRLWIGVQAIEDSDEHELESPGGEYGAEIQIVRDGNFSGVLLIEHKSSILVTRDRGLNSAGFRIYWNF